MKGALLAWLLVAAPPEAREGSEVSAPEVRLEAPGEPVVSGRAFPLTVVRTWAAASAPAPWRDDALAPLVVRQVSTTRRADGGRIEEERRFHAWAFARAPIEVGAPALRETPWTIEVRPEVDAEAPGEPEVPAGPLPVPDEDGGWVVGAAIGLGGLAFALLLTRRARRRRAAPEAAEVVARRALAAAPRDDGPAEISGVVRDYLGARFGLPAHERSAEELIVAAADVADLGGPARERLGRLLLACDRARFAGVRPGRGDEERLLVEARRFVDDTASDGEAS